MLGDSYLDEQKQKKIQDKLTEKARRAAWVKLAKQKDSKLAARLKARWAKEDELVSRRLIFEYRCTVCNRPYTLPRQLPARAYRWCPPCRYFMRRKNARDAYYARQQAQVA